MFEKIRLNKDEVIVFLGSMNAMPMAYAIELKKLGYEIIYFVDAPKKHALSRPECHFPDIAYPYPSWVVEFVLPSQILLPLFPKIFAALYQWKIRRLTEKKIGGYVLNGFFSSLAPFLFGDAKKVGLSHGSDLDVWANIAVADALAKSFKERSIFRYLPEGVSRILIKYIIEKQYIGYVKTDAVVYFPVGFNEAGDQVVRRLLDSGVQYIPRYDASFVQLAEQPREYKNSTEILEILSLPRFLFKTFPEGNMGYSKGNDIIIAGIAKYYSRNKSIRVHFIEKGEDVQCAKEICRQFNIEDIVHWHKEMPFKDLLLLVRDSDVCFDQVGCHWIGAGVYAMYLGKPLIANADPVVHSGVWPVDNPVCSASTPDDVYDWLVKLENSDYRKMVSEKSKQFVEFQMSPLKMLNSLFDIITIKPLS